jgi:hypothetical protein
MQARKYQINCSNITLVKTPYHCTKNTPNAHKRSSKASLLLSTKCGCKYLHQDYKEESGKGRERVGRDFGIIELLRENWCQMRREGFLLYEGERRDPSWMSYKCHPSKRERTSQGRDTFRVLVVS